MKNNVLLIPAAGKGSRSNLDYPKSLFKVKNIPILIRIIDKFRNIKDIKKCVVINKKFKPFFEKEINKKKYKVEYLFQQKQLGMGDAILNFEKSKFYEKTDNIIVIWGDMPFLRAQSIKIAIKIHKKNCNDFTFISTKTKNPYTLIKRNKQKQVIKVIETKEKKIDIKYGEKDIGLFIFKKKLIFSLLKKNLPNKFGKKSKEHGFLYLIEHLHKLKYRVEAICIAKSKEGISFNQIDDIKKYL